MGQDPLDRERLYQGSSGGAARRRSAPSAPWTSRSGTSRARWRGCPSTGCSAPIATGCPPMPARPCSPPSRRMRRRRRASSPTAGRPTRSTRPPIPRSTSRSARRCAAWWATASPSCSIRRGRTTTRWRSGWAASIQELGFYWYEDPLADDDLYNYVKLKQQLHIPILATEYSPGGFTAYAPWLVARATDYLRGDVAVKGGITRAGQGRASRPRPST